jgi:DNA-binding winged helix-turn-helix (wHTH) protein/Tfp pilus assembly protein PilF
MVVGTRVRETYLFGPFRLEGEERLLVRGDTPVPLTPKVFDILLTLVRNSGRLVDKDALMQAVWPDTCVEESSFTRNVSTLRKALGLQPDGSPYIETVTRCGYRFRAPVVTAASDGPCRTLAVLPFRHMGPGDGDDTLGFGLADALITRLSNIAEITVRPTSAVMRYVERQHEAVDAGRELGVEAVLDGHIQQNGDRFRLTVQFLRVDDGKPLWAGKFDSSEPDVFALQDSIADRVAIALELKLTTHQRELLRKRHTSSPEAYHLCEKGRYQMRKFGISTSGLEYLKQAIQIDPEYALAYAELGLAYFMNGPYMMAADEAIAQARRNIDMALELDPSLTDARTAAAMFGFWIDWKRLETDALYGALVASDPNSVMTRHGYAWYLVAMGRFEEAERELAHALRLDPLSPVLHVDRGLPRYFAGDHSVALVLFRQAIEFEPHFWYALYRAAPAHVLNGEIARGIDLLRKCSDMVGGGAPEIDLSLAWALAMAGECRGAEQIVSRYSDRIQPPWISAYEIAAVHVALGDSTSAFEWLETACNERDRWLGWIAVDPRFDRLRNDARFSTVLRRAGFAVHAR